ncbi:hypothetical protein HPB50_011868 [Hyalomma asiaticum]|uniref:Uncharacterized protein n=1 Tax=Hyalomma asiaticum TaxID=266040 RepID=A0ACB7SPL2_HYAAI|nr:hypothetical protein HPB50_011868 [Hyalomma asiaticum]
MPGSVLCKCYLLPSLLWNEIDDLLMTKRQRELLQRLLDDMEHYFRHESTSKLLCHRSESGLLDIDNIEPSLFRQ